jgi:hypothetical protein
MSNNAALSSMLVSESAALETVGAGQLGTARHVDEAVTHARPVGVIPIYCNLICAQTYCLSFTICCIPFRHLQWATESFGTKRFTE